MAQPPPYYDPSKGGPYGYPQQQYQPRPVYVAPQQKSAAQSVGSGIGSVFASAVRAAKPLGETILKSGNELIGSTAKGYQASNDRIAQSPLLKCFATGSGVQLVSKVGKGCLRCLPDGTLDGRGSLGLDYSCHWLVVSNYDNKVILRNGAYPAYHLAHADGVPIARGIGDSAGVYKLHETAGHHVTLEHEMTCKLLSVDASQNVATNKSNDGVLLSDDKKFEVHLAYSPMGHIYKPLT